MQKPLSRLLPLVCCLLLPPHAGAVDPLSADAMAPLRPSPQLAARVGALPCTDQLPAAPLQAIDAVDLALCNNPQTRELWASARAQAALVGVARSAWLPDLDGRLVASRVYAESGDFNQRSAALTLSWLLYDFGLRSANVESAVQLLNAAAATQDAGVQSLFLAALQNYYAAQAARAVVASAEKAERSARESFNAADARYQVGAATPADRLQAQTALSQATLNRIRGEGEARNALGSLANALGFSAQTGIVLADPPALPEQRAFAADVERLIVEAQARRPDLRAAEAQVKAAQASVDVARAQGRPSLSLAAGPSWQSVGGLESHGGNLGVTLNVPLFAGFETTYRVRSAAAQADVRAAQRDRLKNQVALDVWRAWQSLGTATQSLATTADLLASAEQSERVALGRYKAGVGSVLDLLAAQSALAAARVQRIQAVLDWNIYRATLAQAMGALDYTLLQGAAEGRP
jgi:outer membrane protein